MEKRINTKPWNYHNTFELIDERRKCKTASDDQGERKYRETRQRGSEN